MLLLILYGLLKCLQTSTGGREVSRFQHHSLSPNLTLLHISQTFTLQMWHYQPYVLNCWVSRAAPPPPSCRLMNDIIATTEVHVSACTQVCVFFQSCRMLRHGFKDRRFGWIMGGLGQMFRLLLYNTAVQDRFKRWIDCASQYSPSLATDSTDTAEFIKFTMMQGAAVWDETWCYTKTAGLRCYVYPWFLNIAPEDERIWMDGNRIRSVINGPKEFLELHAWLVTGVVYVRIKANVGKKWMITFFKKCNKTSYI